MYKQKTVPSDHPYCRCLFYSANALARASTRLAEEAFGATGLAPSAAYVLMSVLREPGVSPGRLAGIMMLDASTVTRLLERLEKKRLVRRRARGRAVAVYPTAAAEALRPTLAGCAEQVTKRFARLLGRRATGLAADVFEAAVVMSGGAGES
jgi:DNA-binding MarR family transcriptional regulator